MTQPNTFTRARLTVAFFIALGLYKFLEPPGAGREMEQ